MIQAQFEVPNPTPEHMLNVLLTMIDEQEWSPMRHLETNVYVWPNPIQAPPMVARVSMHEYTEEIAAIVRAKYDLTVFGAINTDRNVYFVTDNMIGKLPAAATH